MTTKKSLVQFTHDTGYGDLLLDHINVALGNKDMRADFVLPDVDTSMFEAMKKDAELLIDNANEGSATAMRAICLMVAIEAGGWDLSQCMTCGIPVVCIPDGMPMCEACAVKMAKEQDHGHAMDTPDMLAEQQSANRSTHDPEGDA